MRLDDLQDKNWKSKAKFERLQCEVARLTAELAARTVERDAARQGVTDYMAAGEKAGFAFGISRGAAMVEHSPALVTECQLLTIGELEAELAEARRLLRKARGNLGHSTVCSVGRVCGRCDCYMETLSAELEAFEKGGGE
jgi:hypothetical protein